MTRALVVLLAAISARPAAADRPEVPAAETAPIARAVSACDQLDLTPGALIDPPPDPGALPPPIPWSELGVEGELLDREPAVISLLGPTLDMYRTTLSAATLPELALAIARFGYQLVGHRTDGARLVLRLAPLPMVRHVAINVAQSGVLESVFGTPLDGEIRRRLGVRTGTYLPWDERRRRCVLQDEIKRIAAYLNDEGFYDVKYRDGGDTATGEGDAHVAIDLKIAGSEASLVIDVNPGSGYELGRVDIVCPIGTTRENGRCVDPISRAVHELAVPEAEIRDAFQRGAVCVYTLCVGRARFTRAQFQQDLKTVKEKFHQRGYPAVRIRAEDPAAGTNARTKKVNLSIAIEHGRRIEVLFEGHDRAAIDDAELRTRLTFDRAGAADDVEIAESARELTDYLQTRGYFDARVTWTRDRIDIEPRPGTREAGVHFDRIRFRIDAGKPRRVARVEFVGNRAIDEATLEELIATKVGQAGGLFRSGTAVTSAGLLADAERIVEAYRRAGFREARVRASASPHPRALDDAAATAALVAAGRGDEIHIRFAIEEGPPTTLARIAIVGDDDGAVDAAVCEPLIAELASALAEPRLRRMSPDTCIAAAPDVRFRPDDMAAARDRVRDYLLASGRPRARVEYATVPLAADRVEARYRLTRIAPLRLGRVVIRGAFKTKESVIRRQLGFKSGDPLTTDRLANGARRLRNMGLFDAVHIDLPDLEREGEVISAVVRVEERYDHTAEVEIGGGVSSLTGIFGTGRWLQRNIAGRGIEFLPSGTLGQRLQEVELALRVPTWLVPSWSPVLFRTDMSGLYRWQDTERFGELTTLGAGLAFAWQRSRPRTDLRPARSRNVGVYYDFRLRARNVDALRPIGADMDQPQIAVQRRTGAFGVRAEWDQRIDRDGQLAPLAPERGFRLEGSVSIASPYLLGQDTFIKVSASGSRFVSLGKHVVLRADLRYDQGFPLGDAVLLPEFDRFFAGGDSTVRGYAEDRLKTELVEVGVPPLDNVTQIRVIPAGANIRVLGSLDAQVRIWKVIAGAMFVDAGLLTNTWSVYAADSALRSIGNALDDIRPGAGMGVRAVSAFGVVGLEYAVPLRPRLGDDPRGRSHIYISARAQF